MWIIQILCRTYDSIYCSWFNESFYLNLFTIIALSEISIQLYGNSNKGHFMHVQLTDVIICLNEKKSRSSTLTNNKQPSSN